MLWVRKFLGENFRKFINFFFHFIHFNYDVSKSSIAKWCCIISTFLTNNSIPRSLRFNFMHCVVFSSTAPGNISDSMNHSNGNSTSRFLLIFREIFGKISRNIKFPQSSKPWLAPCCEPSSSRGHSILDFFFFFSTLLFQQIYTRISSVGSRHKRDRLETLNTMHVYNGRNFLFNIIFSLR